MKIFFYPRNNCQMSEITRLHCEVDISDAEVHFATSKSLRGESNPAPLLLLVSNTDGSD